MSETRSTIALAVLHDGGLLDAPLREALEALGAHIVYDSTLAALDHARLKSSGARVVVINLGESDNDYDAVFDRLEADGHEIVINDAEVCAHLDSAERMRWARHLAAKILHRPEIVLPPRPEGAQAPPTFEQYWAAKVPVAEKIQQPGERIEKPVPIITAVAIAPVLPAVETKSALTSGHSTAAAPPPSLKRDDSAQALLDDPELLAAIENFDLESEGGKLPRPEFASYAPRAPAAAELDIESALATLEGNFDVEPDFRPSSDQGLESLLGDKKHEEVQSLLGADSDRLIEAVARMEKPAQTGVSTASVRPQTPSPLTLMPLDEEISAKPPVPDEFGIETIPTKDFLAPPVEKTGAKPLHKEEIANRIPGGFGALELVPIDSEDIPAPRQGPISEHNLEKSTKDRKTSESGPAKKE